MKVNSQLVSIFACVLISSTALADLVRWPLLAETPDKKDFSFFASELPTFSRTVNLPTAGNWDEDVVSANQVLKETYEKAQKAIDARSIDADAKNAAKERLTNKYGWGSYLNRPAEEFCYFDDLPRVIHLLANLNADAFVPSSDTGIEGYRVNVGNGDFKTYLNSYGLTWLDNDADELQKIVDGTRTSNRGDAARAKRTQRIQKASELDKEKAARMLAEAKKLLALPENAAKFVEVSSELFEYMTSENPGVDRSALESWQNQSKYGDAWILYVDNDDQEAFDASPLARCNQ